MPNTLAYGLAVVSSDGQEESLPYQQAWITEAAARNGWTVGRLFSGVASGRNGVRQLVSDMVAAITALPKGQRPARVLMIRTDRLGREPLEVTGLLADIRNLGVLIHTRTDGDLTLSKASGALLPMIQSIVAGLENEARIDKTNTVYNRKKRHRAEHAAKQATEGRVVGISPRPPYGLTWDENYEFYIPKSPEADALRVAYDMKCQGYGNHLIGKRMRQIAPPLLRKDGTPVPQQWESDRVRKTLSLEVYRGTIVDEATWARAQIPARVVAQPKRKWDWPLGGALRCAECEKPLIGLAGAKPEKWRWYMCRNHVAHGKMICHRNTVVEEHFEALLVRLTATPGLVESYTASDDPDRERNLQERRLTRLRTEMARYDERRKRLFRGFEDGLVSNDEFSARREELRVEYDGQQAEIAEIEHAMLLSRARREGAERASEIIADAARVWAVANTEDRRAISKAVGDLVGGLYVERGATITMGSERKTT